MAARVGILLLACAALGAGHDDGAVSSSGRRAVRGVIVFDVYRVKNVGRVACGLYRPGDAWLAREPYEGVLGEPRGHRARCVFEDVPPGRYAISAIHDEDSEGDFDRGLFGIPTEGWTASNDAHLGRLGPPRFDDALFAFDGRLLRLRARMRY